MIDFVEVGEVLGQVAIDPDLDLALAVDANHVGGDFKIACLFEHLLIALQSRLHHVQSFGQGHVDDFQQPDGDALDVDGGREEGGAHAPPSTGLNVQTVDQVAELLALIEQV